MEWEDLPYFIMQMQSDPTHITSRFSFAHCASETHCLMHYQIATRRARCSFHHALFGEQVPSSSTHFEQTEESTSIKVRYAKINYTRELILPLCSLQTNKRLFQLWRNRDCRRRQTTQRRCEGRKLIINITRDDCWCVARNVRSQHCRHIESVVFNLLFLSAHIHAFHVSLHTRRSS